MPSPKERDPWGGLDRTDIRARRFEDTAPSDWSASTNSTFAEPGRRRRRSRRSNLKWKVAGAGLLLAAISALAFALRR